MISMEFYSQNYVFPFTIRSTLWVVGISIQYFMAVVIVDYLPFFIQRNFYIWNKTSHMLPYHTHHLLSFTSDCDQFHSLTLALLRQTGAGLFQASFRLWQDGSAKNSTASLTPSSRRHYQFVPQRHTLFSFGHLPHRQIPSSKAAPQALPPLLSSPCRLLGRNPEYP